MFFQAPHISLLFISLSTTPLIIIFKAFAINLTMKTLSAFCLILLSVFSTFSSAAVVEHTFNVDTVAVQRLCNQQVITVVNGSFPGPTITVHEGDSLIMHVINNSPHDMTIHWHGVIQFANGWADGPDYITQCPIAPGTRYTYRFNVTGQEGTLWWHAHISYLRATVNGLLVILPRQGRSYPFRKPYAEVPIILGEWWDADVVDVVNRASANGVPPDLSDALLINGQPGDQYDCSSNSTYRVKVKKGKTYLLRMLNAGLQFIQFFKIANHSMTVVAVDASYTKPYKTDVITIAPGQTIDVLLKANQPRGSYYMAALTHMGSDFVSYNDGITTAIIEYDKAKRPSTPIMPILPDANDTATAYRFLTNLTALTSAPFYHPVPKKVDERMYITIGLGFLPCGGNGTCGGPGGNRIGASMNNVSFELATTKSSFLEAFHNNVSGVYTTDFPVQPPVKFDYTNPANLNNSALLPTSSGTKVAKIKYNSTVEIVFQNIALGALEMHPMHLHGYDFHIVGQGVGNYNNVTDPQKFNLKNPQIRNTVAVPMGGWAAIRFQANNPGVWFIHCHLEVHVPWGLAGAIIVENGPTPETSVIAPPADLPKCK